MATDTAPTPTDQPRRPERVSTREGGRSRSLPALIGDYGAMILLAAFFLFPVVFMVVSSLKPDEQIFADLTSPAAFLPVGDISLANYGAVFERIPAWRFLGNSFFVTVVTVILGLIVNSMAGFALSRMRWRGRKIVFAIIIALAIGAWIYFSTRNLIITGITLLVCAIVIVLFLPLNKSVYTGFIGNVLAWFSLMARYQDFTRGLLKISSIIYYLSFSAFFLFLTVRLIEKRRWS